MRFGLFSIITLVKPPGVETEPQVLKSAGEQIGKSFVPDCIERRGMRERVQAQGALFAAWPGKRGFKDRLEPVLAFPKGLELTASFLVSI